MANAIQGRRAKYSKCSCSNFIKTIFNLKMFVLLRVSLTIILHRDYLYEFPFYKIIVERTESSTFTISIGINSRKIEQTETFATHPRFYLSTFDKYFPHIFYILKRTSKYWRWFVNSKITLCSISRSIHRGRREEKNGNFPLAMYICTSSRKYQNTRYETIII